MKRLIVLLLFCFSGLAATSQTLTKFNGTFNVYASTLVDTDTFEIQGFFNNNLGEYMSDAASPGDMVWDASCNRFVIDSIINSMGGIIVCRVVDLNSAGSFTLGLGALMTETDLNNLPLFIAGLPNTLQSCIRTHFSIQVDDLATDITASEGLSKVGDDIQIGGNVNSSKTINILGNANLAIRKDINGSSTTNTSTFTTAINSIDNISTGSGGSFGSSFGLTFTGTNNAYIGSAAPGATGRVGLTPALFFMSGIGTRKEVGDGLHIQLNRLFYDAGNFGTTGPKKPIITGFSGALAHNINNELDTIQSINGSALILWRGNKVLRGRLRRINGSTIGINNSQKGFDGNIGFGVYNHNFDGVFGGRSNNTTIDDWIENEGDYAFYDQTGWDNYFKGRLGLGQPQVHASAIFEANSTTQGILFPRMTTAQRNAIATPAAGLMVYDNTLNEHYGYDGTAWYSLAGAGGSSIYTANGTLTGDRTVDGDGNQLLFLDNSFTQLSTNSTAASYAGVLVEALIDGNPANELYIQNDGMFLSNYGTSADFLSRISSTAGVAFNSELVAGSTDRFYVQDNRGSGDWAAFSKKGLQLLGFGETGTDDATGANYASLVGTSLVPKKYVDDLAALNVVDDNYVPVSNGTTYENSLLYQNTAGLFVGHTGNATRLLGSRKELSADPAAIRDYHHFETRFTTAGLTLANRITNATNHLNLGIDDLMLHDASASVATVNSRNLITIGADSRLRAGNIVNQYNEINVENLASSFTDQPQTFDLVNLYTGFRFTKNINSNIGGSFGHIINMAHTDDATNGRVGNRNVGLYLTKTIDNSDNPYNTQHGLLPANSDWAIYNNSDEASFTGKTEVTQFRAEVEYLTTNTTITELGHTYIIDASAGDVTLTLPATADAYDEDRGAVIYVVVSNTNSGANTATIAANGSETINGAASTSTTTAYDSFTLQAFAGEWFIIK